MVSRDWEINLWFAVAIGTVPRRDAASRGTRRTKRSGFLRHRRHPYCEIPYGELPGSIYSRNIGTSNYRAAALVSEAARMDQDRVLSAVAWGEPGS